MRDVSRLEEKLDRLEESRLDKIELTLTELVETQKIIEKELERYRGTVGAILLVGTAIAAFMKFFWADAVKWANPQ